MEQHSGSGRSAGAGRRASGIADAFVVIAMSVVAVAVGLGIHVQLEASLMMAGALSVGLYAMMIGTHLLVLRARSATALRAEIGRLNAQLAELRRDAAQAAGHPHLSGPRMPTSLQGYPSLPETARSRPDEPVAAVANLGSVTPTPRPTLGELPITVPLGVDPPQPLSGKPVGSPAGPSAPPPPAAPPPLPSADRLTPNADRSSPYGASPATVAVAGPTLSAPAPDAAPRHPVAWGLRPGLHRDPLVPVSGAVAPPVRPLPAADGSRSVASEAPPPLLVTTSATAPTMPPSPGPDVAQAMAGTETKGPGSTSEEVTRHQTAAPEIARSPSAAPKPASIAESAAPDSGTDAREFDAMQKLIQQLAAQLNAPLLADEGRVDTPADGAVSEAASPKPAPAVAPTAATVASVTEATIDRSVAALRVTASGMRRTEDAIQSLAAGRPDRKLGVQHGPPEVPPTASVDARGVPPARLSEPGLGATSPAPATPPAPSPYGRLALIAEAVSANRVEVYLDPILALEPRKARHFEVSVRLRTAEDEEIAADVYRPAAAHTGLLPQIDQAKLTRVARVAERLRARGSGGSLFSALAGESLADDGFLEAFADMFADAGDLGTRLVLAFTQSDVRAFGSVHWDALSTMKDIGLRFSLEEVADLDMDFERLKSGGFDFVKLDAPVFLEGLPAPGGPIPAADLCRHLSGLGLALVVGRIDDERDLAKIMGFGVVFGQGTLFGAPRPVRIDPAPETAAA
jgi:cyclic-di-GMP phosphodiesterase TipF (flagellum assembly factor)